MTILADRLVGRARGGRKLLVPYIMGGIPDRRSFPAALAAAAEHADAVEIGLPYSDPLMDGPVIASAGERAIRDGTGPIHALELAGSVGSDALKIAMTYYNPVYRLGEAEFCRRAAGMGFVGMIVPDVPLEESTSLRRCAAAEGLAWIPLVAPTTPDRRVKELADSATGFVYAVSTLGVTGTREQMSERAARVAGACRSVTDLAVLVGIGVSSPAHARATAEHADGVVVGSAVVRRVLDEGAESARAFLADFRVALDEISRTP